jgi:hypothetical protein
VRFTPLSALEVPSTAKKRRCAMMGKRQNLHINLHNPHLCKRISLYVRYLQADTADLKSVAL